jgi:hypothetical protein
MREPVSFSHLMLFDFEQDTGSYVAISGRRETSVRERLPAMLSTPVTRKKPATL